jgi:biotin carboxyl carrier protein
MATRVRTEMTGLVQRIEKQVGDTVQAGDALIILEAMKMELPIEAPVEGTVAEIHCKVGQSVAEGDVVVVLA